LVKAANSLARLSRLQKCLGYEIKSGGAIALGTLMTPQAIRAFVAETRTLFSFDQFEQSSHSIRQKR
jgi:hypothetical protein